MNTEVSNAVSVLVKELKSDPDCFYTWQSNIAVAFMDAYGKEVNEEGSVPKEGYDIHKIANDAAISFLNSLCHTRTESN